MHKSSFDKMKRFKEIYLDKQSSLKIFDLGSSDMKGAYKEIFEEEKWEYFGADLVERENVDIVLDDPYDWSNVPDESFDVVISGQTFEHVEFFWITMMQINRILKPNGIVCIIAPAGGIEHKAPMDCWRFYPDGMYALARWAGMESLEVSTQWKGRNYGDGSDFWMDSFLVCKKKINQNELNQVLSTMLSWVSKISTLKENDLIPKPDIEELFYRQKLLNYHKIELEEFREMFDPLFLLMRVYLDRPDLQQAFPEAKNGINLSRLIKWAKNNGIHEDQRLKDNADLFLKIEKEQK